MSIPIVRVNPEEPATSSSYHPGCFAFGETSDSLVWRRVSDDGVTQGFDQLPLSKIQALASENGKFSYRYKLLNKAIAPFLNKDLLADPSQVGVSLVEIDRGPLYISVFHESENRGILSFGLQLYIPVEVGNAHSGATTLRDQVITDFQPWEEDGTRYGHFIYESQTPSDETLEELSPKFSLEPTTTTFPWVSIGQGYDIQQDFTPQALCLARRWLEECTSPSSNHSYCGRSPPEPLLPPRVIHVQNPDHTYIYIPGYGETSRYATLSHCWGGVAPLVTTTSRLAEFMNRLPTDIPQTFADAITVARGLGFKYLWIDSLCIVQDSIEDWQAHAIQMHAIYSRSTLTISADAADNANSGFLGPGCKKLRKTVEIDCTQMLEGFVKDGGQHGGTVSVPRHQHIVHVRERGDLALQLPYHDFPPNHPESPRAPVRSKLSTRGWAFQERLLSCRTLHFSCAEMAWECRSTCTCECSATNYPRTQRWSSLLKGARALAVRPDDPMIQWENERDVHNSWRIEIVREYTQLDLTKVNDRLSALAGVAEKALSVRSDDQYILGLWKNTLAGDLLWYVTEQRRSQTIAATGSEAPMPSWSWASVTGAISYGLPREPQYERCEAPLLEVVSINCDVGSRGLEFAIGPKTAASITVSGNLIQIIGLRHHGDNRWFIEWPEDCWLHGHTVALADIHAGIPGTSTPTADEVNTASTALGPRDLSAIVQSKTEQLYALLAHIKRGEVYGLILARTPSKDGKEAGFPSFVRVGMINGTRDRPERTYWSSSGDQGYHPDDDWMVQNAETPVQPNNGKDSTNWLQREKTTIVIW